VAFTRDGEAMAGSNQLTLLWSPASVFPQFLFLPTRLQMDCAAPLSDKKNGMPSARQISCILRDACHEASVTTE
jgi:hypothetical protein